ncbi:MAG: 50S ribosomal protein L15 [Aeriscardovia sp.]|nr:50S ribosomal protein L15 [Aeriscardovia sp.]
MTDKILQINDLHPAPGAKKAPQRVGRGEGSKGKTSGRGTKGTKARYQVRPGFEGGALPLYMRLPKKRGFKSPFHKEYLAINLSTLSRLFPNGGQIDEEALENAGILRRGQVPKILAEGEASAAFSVKGVRTSATAAEKIKAAGGSVEESK